VILKNNPKNNINAGITVVMEQSWAGDGINSMGMGREWGRFPLGHTVTL